jgi:hypothetical protein
MRAIDPTARSRKIQQSSPAARASRESALVDMLRVVYSLLIFLFPVALYSLALAYVNRSRRPVIVPGTWDVAGLLFGLTGFLLWTMPGLLDVMVGQFIDHLHHGPSRETLDVWVKAIRIGYFAVVAVAVALLLVVRRHQTAIYNVDTDRFRERLGAALAALGLDSVEESGRLVIAPVRWFQVANREAISSSPVRPAVRPSDKVLDPPPGGPPAAALTIDIFPTFCHVTLRWESYSGQARRDIEAQLQDALENAVAIDNPVAGWLLGFSGLTFLLITMLAIFFVSFVIWQRPR